MPWTAVRAATTRRSTPSSAAALAAASAARRVSASLGSRITRRGSGRADAVEQLGRGGPPPGSARDHHRPGRPERPGQALAGRAAHDRLRVRGPAGGVSWSRKWVTMIRCGRPASMPASMAAPTSSTCTCTFHRSPAPTTRSESPSPSSRSVRTSTASSVAVGEQVHHLVCRSARFEVVPRAARRGTGWVQPARRRNGSSPANDSALGRRRSRPARGTRAAARSRRRRRRPRPPARAGGSWSGSRPAPSRAASSAAGATAYRSAPCSLDRPLAAPAAARDDAEDRALDGVGDARPGQLVGPGHRGSEPERADAGHSGGRRLVGEAAEDLAEDDAGVAPGGEQRGPGEDVGLGGEVLVVHRMTPSGAVLVLDARAVERPSPR